MRRPFLIAAALGISTLTTACGGGEDRSPAAASAAVLVGPEEFARRIEAPGVVTINVHVPDEGSLAGTDLTIPFEQIATSDALPADRSTPLAVYCRSGNMSADAVEDLAAMGYTDVVELEGGFNAWVATGRPLIPAAAPGY